MNLENQLHLTAHVTLYQNGLETKKFILPPLTEMGEVGQIDMVRSADQVDAICAILFEGEQEKLSPLGNPIHL